MRVLHIINTLSPRAGGPTSVLNALARHQAQAGIEVTICTTNADYPAGVLSVPTGQPIQDGGITTWYFQVQFEPLLVSLPLKSWLDESMSYFDIVHIHGLYRFPVTYAAWRARRAIIPYLICPHGSLSPFLFRQSRRSIVLKRLYERLFDFPNLNGASAIHYTASDEVERSAFIGLRAPAAIVPNGLDWRAHADLPVRGRFRERIGVRSDSPLLLFLGRLSFVKGLDILVPAFARLASVIPEAHLAIVGPDTEGLGRDVRRWCCEHGIDSQVSFVNHIPPSETREAYVDADVFVLPSYTESFGMTVVEAMACGCPVVISDQVNIWREVAETGAGRVVNLDVAAVAEAMVSLVSDKVTASRMGAAGRALVEHRYSWPAIVGDLSNVYASLLAGKKDS